MLFFIIYYFKKCKTKHNINIAFHNYKIKCTHNQVTSKMAAKLLFKANFHQEFELFSRNKVYANIGGHFNFKIVSIIKKTLNLST